MKKVTPIKSCSDIPYTLRAIADDIESGQYQGVDSCSFVIGTDIYQLGTVSTERAVTNAIFDFTFAIHKLMDAGLNGN